MLSWNQKFENLLVNMEQKFSSERVELWSVVTYDDGMMLEPRLVFPVVLTPYGVVGGWSRNANNQEEFRELLAEGLRLSSVSEVMIAWEK